MERIPPQIDPNRGNPGCPFDRAPVLLVDDQKVTGILLGKMLISEPSLELHALEDPTRALEVARSLRPSVILLDLVMPHIDGLALLRLFRQEEEFSSVPIIMLSTEEQARVKAQAFAEGANDYLIKLPEKVEMLARLRYHADSYCNFLHMKRTEEQLAESARRFRLVTQSVGDAIVTADTEARITFWNWGAERIFGFTEEEIMGQSLMILIPEPFRDRFTKAFRRVLDKGSSNLVGRTIELNGLRRTGESFPLELSLALLHSEGRNSFVTVIRDITERKVAEEKLHHQATHDALTGLPNRAYFLTRLAHNLALAKRQKSGLALLFIDLDRFKWVNDTLGHAAGDLLLKEVARRLLSCVRESDTIARLGGDEFTAILFGNSDRSRVTLVASRILEHLSTPFILEEQEVTISGSVGITFYPQDGEEMDVLLRNADLSMYVAKNSGRNAFWFFQP